MTETGRLTRTFRMKNILPRDEHVWFLVAQAIRSDGDGKMSLFGFLGTERVVIASATLPAVLPVTFMFLLREGEGSFAADFSIRDPGGRVVHREELPPAQKPLSTENHGIAVTMAPLVVSAFGTYRIILRLDGKKYRRDFTIDPDGAPVINATLPRLH
jgi:hypothetical protein